MGLEVTARDDRIWGATNPRGVVNTNRTAAMGYAACTLRR